MQESVEELKDFVPVEVCHLEYCSERGSAIDPHLDDKWLWGERLVTLSLVSDSVLTLTNEKFDNIKIQVPMPARSLLMLRGTARHVWKHGIERSDIHGIRLAMTFRELSDIFKAGGEQEEIGNKVLEIAKTFQGKPLYNE